MFNLAVTRNEMIMKLYFSFCCYMLYMNAVTEKNKFKLKLKLKFLGHPKSCCCCCCKFLEIELWFQTKQFARLLE